MSREKIILELVQRLPEDVKLHTSGKQVSRLSSFSQKADFKPKGLWYACGDEWIQWAINENYGFGDWVYLVHIDMAKMLKLKNAAEVRGFSAEFEVPRNSLSKSEYYHFNIDWPKVAARYSGIEICPYVSSLRLEPEVAWYYGWDVASGCVWDPSALKLELVGHWDGKEFAVADKSRFAREQQYDTDYFQKRPISPENRWEMPDMGEEPLSEITTTWRSVNPQERGKHLMMSRELLKVAKDLLAFEFPSQDALNDYLKQHPAANKTKHWVTRTQVPTPAVPVPATPPPRQPAKRRMSDFSLNTARASFSQHAEAFERSMADDVDILAKHGIVGEAEQDKIMGLVGGNDGYTGIVGRGLNNCLRGIEAECGDHTREVQESVDKYLSIMPKISPDIPVYRGAPLKKEVVSQWVDSLMKGQEVSFSDPAYFSASLDPDIALFYSYPDGDEDSVMFRIKTSKGVRLTWSSHKKEKEVLLPRQAKLRIVGCSFLPVKGKPKGTRSPNDTVIFDVVDDGEGAS
jgi:hypothetical protein